MRAGLSLTAAALCAAAPAAAQQVDTTAPAAFPAPASSPPKWVHGAELELMVTKEVNSRSARAGERFKLRVNAPLLIDGKIVIPIGARAWGEVLTVSGTSAAGGRGQLSVKLLYVETEWGDLALTGSTGTEGKGNAAGVALGVLSFGLLGLLNKGQNATLKAGAILKGYVAEGDPPVAAPMVVPDQSWPSDREAFLPAQERAGTRQE